MIHVAFVGVGHIHTPGFIKRLKERQDVKVKYVWDHNAERAQKLYGETPANMVRISMEANAHLEDGSVDESLYGPMLISIANIRAVNPAVKIFASLKLKEAQTFPAWVASDEDGTINY